MVRLSELSDLKAGRIPALATGDVPGVARALTIQPGDLIVGARGLATDVLVANDAVLAPTFPSTSTWCVRITEK